MEKKRIDCDCFEDWAHEAHTLGRPWQAPAAGLRLRLFNLVAIFLKRRVARLRLDAKSVDPLACDGTYCDIHHLDIPHSSSPQQHSNLKTNKININLTSFLFPFLQTENILQFKCKNN